MSVDESPCKCFPQLRFLFLADRSDGYNIKFEFSSLRQPTFMLQVQ